MNAVLPVTDTTGALSITEVFDFYDGPKLFVCQNPAGHYFLGYWVGSDPVGESYWILPMSRERYLAIRSGSVSLRDAFSQPELGYLLECKVRFSGGKTATTRLVPARLDPELIPASDEYVQLRTETLPVRMRLLDLAGRAVATRREVLGLHFEFPGTREEGPTKLVGKLLVSLQDLLDALGQKIAGSPTLRGFISNEILFKTETRLTQAAGGSFGIEVTAATETNLFGQSLISDSINELLQTLDVGNDVDKLRQRLMEMKPRAASKYGVLLSNLIASQSPFKVDWASPTPSRNRSVSLDLFAAAGALRTVEQVTREVGETRTLVGHFVGIDLLGKSFMLILREDEETYRGKIADEAMDAAAHVTMNQTYRISIRETLEVTASGEERLRLTVEKIEELDQRH